MSCSGRVPPLDGLGLGLYAGVTTSFVGMGISSSLWSSGTDCVTFSHVLAPVVAGMKVGEVELGEAVRAVGAEPEMEGSCGCGVMLAGSSSVNVA